MKLYNRTQIIIDRLIEDKVNSSNIINNGTLPWYVNGEGAMAFSISVILVFGMSIIFFIMLSINKTRTDREEEKQIWSYLKTYRQVRSDALKDDEQRIRAKLLFMSILGEQNKESTVVNGKVSKSRDKRHKVKPIAGCLRVDSDIGDSWPKLSNSQIENSLDERLVTLRKPNELRALNREYRNGSRDSVSDEESLKALLTQNLGDTGMHVLNTQKTRHHLECDSSEYQSDENAPNAVRRKHPSCPDSQTGKSVPNSQPRLPQVASLKIIQTLKDDALEQNQDLSQTELDTIRARRRKRSGCTTPKRELLEIGIPPGSELLDKFQVETEIHGYTVPSSPVQFAIGEENITNSAHTGHYQKSANANKGQRILIDTSKPRLTRRAQSFRFHDRKKSRNRKRSLDLPRSLESSNDNLEIQDKEYSRSLKCRRHDRQSRISVVCLPDSDSGSSNDIILPAITLPQNPEKVSNSGESSPDDFVQEILGAVSRRSSSASVFRDFDESLENNDRNDLAEPDDNSTTTEVRNVLNVDTATAPSKLDTCVSGEGSYPQKYSRNRRSGVIQLDYKR